MRDPSHELEVGAMEAGFRVLCQRWALTPDEVAALLGPSGPREVEEARRILLEFDRAMRAMFGEDGVRRWLREEGPTGMAPLSCLVLGQDQRRAFLAAARQRHFEVLGYHA